MSEVEKYVKEWIKKGKPFRADLLIDDRQTLNGSPLKTRLFFPVGPYIKI